MPNESSVLNVGTATGATVQGVAGTTAVGRWPRSERKRHAIPSGDRAVSARGEGCSAAEGWGARLGW
jgi:hypothetical protein